MVGYVKNVNIEHSFFYYFPETVTDRQSDGPTLIYIELLLKWKKIRLTDQKCHFTGLLNFDFLVPEVLCDKKTTEWSKIQFIGNYWSLWINMNIYHYVELYNYFTSKTIYILLMIENWQTNWQTNIGMKLLSQLKMSSPNSTQAALEFRLFSLIIL